MVPAKGREQKRSRNVGTDQFSIEHRIHDSGYKKLFSNKTFFRQLMETFVHEDWVKEIDFDSCETLDKSFVSDHYKQTESDLIYRVKLKDQDLIVFILMEFQSAPDRWMALRMLNYISNFYMDLIESNKKQKELPPLFPIVLYNGSARWTAPVRFQDLVKQSQRFGRFGVRFEYFKLAENEYTPEQLLGIRNIVSTLFLAETDDHVERLMDELLYLFDSESDRQAVSMLINWFRMLAEHDRIEQQDYEKIDTIYRDKSEARSMLIESIKKSKKEERN